MKTFLPALAGVLAIALAQPSSAQAQAPCDIKSIYTDPTRPTVNPEYPARTNTFNWYMGRQNSGMVWSLNSVAINEANIKSQFAYTPNSQTVYLKFILNLKPKVTTANTQNVLVVLKYPVTMRSVGGNPHRLLGPLLSRAAPDGGGRRAGHVHGQRLPSGRYAAPFRPNKDWSCYHQYGRRHRRCASVPQPGH